MRGKDEFTGTALSVLLQFTYQILSVCVSVLSAYLYLNRLCLCVCVFTHVCMMQCLEVPEYISCCVQSGAGLWLLYFFFLPLIPPLAPLKWQFVKHGPLLALSLASQPIPAWPLPSLICPPPLLFASLVLLPSLTFPPLSSHFHTSRALCIFGYLPLSACLSPSVVPSLSLSFALPSPCDFSSSLSLPLFFSPFVHRCCCTLITSSISPSCTYFLLLGISIGFLHIMQLRVCFSTYSIILVCT